ncbi:MAG: hypothetical protein ABJB03_01700 [Rhodoglobus sp.]
MKFKKLLAASTTAIAVSVVLALAGCTPDTAPEPTPSSSPTSFEDAGNLLAACLTERGWNVVVDPATGGVSTPEGVPVAQAPLYNADVADCLHQFGPPRPLTDDEKVTYYAELEDVATCLESKGYPAADKPTFQNFSESDTGNWDPYGAIPTGSEQEAAIEACPQPDPFF